MNTTVGAIGQIALTVRDVDAALAFYEGILGLPLLMRPAPDLAFLAAGGVRLMLTTPPGAGTVGAGSILYFRVADAAAAFDDLVARGATAERGPQLTAKMPDHDLWLAFLRDPDGTLVGLMEERRPPA